MIMNMKVGYNMNDEIVGFILFIGFLLLGLGFGIGFICGNNGIVTSKLFA